MAHALHLLLLLSLHASGVHGEVGAAVDSVATSALSWAPRSANGGEHAGVPAEEAGDSDESQHADVLVSDAVTVCAPPAERTPKTLVVVARGPRDAVASHAPRGPPVA